ncbi:hypothetical protein RJD39_04800 [Vibrio scophthalmi]|uniref:hypothetical protein n=1 Tax=Vibrio scophthalmi TaxID=45658 RepID=UPI003872A908
MEPIYLTDELKLKSATLILVNDQITVEAHNKTLQYQNTYTAFSFDQEHNELCAPNFKLTVCPDEAQAVNNWLMDLFI